MKKLSFIFISLALVIFVTGCDKKEKTNQTQKANTIVKEEIKEEKQSPSFDDKIKEYNEVYKKALLSTGQEKEEAAITTEKSTELWKNIVSEYAGNQPKEYKKTKNWGEFITEINSLQEKANNLVNEGNLKEAHEELELVRKKIKEVRQENNIKNLSDDMLTFHDIMEKVIEAETKEEFITDIVELKMTFTQLKGYSPGEGYDAVIFSIEKAISEIENSTDATYTEKRDNLKPAFIKAYMLFG